jgi:hypothetical protein
MKPIFAFNQITQKNLVGVDITTQAVSMTDLWSVLICAVIVGAIVLVLSLFLKPVFEMLLMLIVFVFFGNYIYLYFINTLSYYAAAITALGTASVLSISLFVFLIATIIFYLGGFIIFLVETTKSYFRF